MIIPSVDIRGGAAVQLIGGETLAIDAGDPLAAFERFAVAGDIAVIDLDAALGTGDNAAIIAELARRGRVRVGGGIRDLDTARRWLDLGVDKIILGTAADPELLSQLPAERVIAALDARDGEIVVKGWTEGTGRRVPERMAELAPYVSGFLVTAVEKEGRMGGVDLDAVQILVDSAGGRRVTFAGGVTTAEEIAALDRIGADAQVGMALYRGDLDLADAITAPLVSDRPDGLWPTVVTDERGTSLGLVYSNAESVRTAIAEKRGVYWSRSRGLWRKGESSGDTQELLRIEPDCDRDSLRVVVRQSGRGFCHLGADTCFGDERPGSGALAELEQVLAARRDEPEEGSYTAKLLGDASLLSGKLLEEAEELGAAASRDEVVHEAADVMYFAMVAMARAGVTLDDVQAELAKRRRATTRREGSAPKGAGAAVVTPSTPAEPRMRRVSADDVAALSREAFDDATLATVTPIVDDVRRRGLDAVREHGQRLGDWSPDAPLIYTADDLGEALERVDADTRALLERTAQRIGAFAESQRAALSDVDVAVPGGRAGHRVMPVSTAGCYAPGGRFPLPSSVLMTAVTARVAGVPDVWVASPRPAPVTLAAAAVAGADGLLAVGGAQAIAALAHGAGDVPACDVIAGPGNRYVTAAKMLASATTKIDMLAGPSELVVVAGPNSDPRVVAADLLAQAEHDVDALPVVVTADASLADAVDAEVTRQLADLPTADTARVAVSRGLSVVVRDEAEVLDVCERLAPEHLEVLGDGSSDLAARLSRFGGLFVGDAAAEVFGDYGVGPNHVLPTGGTARSTAGLSVATFLRPATWLTMDPADPAYADVVSDCATLARLEGLEAHARAAEARR